MIDDEEEQEELFRSLCNAYDNFSALVSPILLPALDPSEKPTNTTETAPVNQHPLPSWPPRDSENVDVAAGLGILVLDSLTARVSDSARGSIYQGRHSYIAQRSARMVVLSYTISQ